MKTNRFNRHVTFSDILTDVGQGNAEKLMARALAFNHLAKTSESERQTIIAYRWKSRCLNHLIQKCNNYLCVVKDDISNPHEGLVLVHLKRNKRGLHTHSKWLNQN